MFQATVSYDRTRHVATMVMQPLSAATHEAVGSPSSLKASVVAGQNVTFSVDSLAADVVSDANASGEEFAFTGTVAGVIKDEMDFCGVVTGTYTTLTTATPTPLPSITIGALKDADPAATVSSTAVATISSSATPRSTSARPRRATSTARRPPAAMAR
jgi:hypothetical protein